MIKYVSRENIDEKKYNACIKNAKNSLVYAYSWYLDAVCYNWDILVYKDYVAVMPLPNKKKYGLGYVYLPPWIQQLGVFFIDDLSPKIQSEFIRSVPRKFLFLELLFNAKNVLPKNANKRDNFLLRLDKSHNEIWKNYSEGRKYSIKKAIKNDLTLRAISTTDGLDLLLELDSSKAHHFPENHIGLLRKLTKTLLNRDVAAIYHIFNKKKLLGGALIVKDEYRLTYLFSTLSPAGRKQGAMSFLIDSLLEQHENSGLIFDFEGSMVQGVAAFFKSFGAIKESYCHIRKYRIF